MRQVAVTLEAETRSEVSCHEPSTAGAPKAPDQVIVVVAMAELLVVKEKCSPSLNEVPDIGWSNQI